MNQAKEKGILVANIKLSIFLMKTVPTNVLNFLANRIFYYTFLKNNNNSNNS